MTCLLSERLGETASVIMPARHGGVPTIMTKQNTCRQNALIPDAHEPRPLEP